MKKIFLNLIILCSITFYATVCVKADSNRYIVKVKENTATLMYVGDKVSYIGEGLYFTENIEELNDFISSENIESIFPDYELELFDLDYPTVTSDTHFNDQWYLGAIDSISLRDKGLSGEGVKIAIIDSGINSSHPDLNQSNILQGYNCTVDAKDISDYTDKVGHGTMVAGIIAAQTDNEVDISGIACNAQIIPIKITDQNTLNLSSIFSGLEKALETDCDIINMSFGGAITDVDALSVLKSYIDKAEEKGIIVVAAVGNSGHLDNSVNYPAGFDNVIGVGSVDEDLTASYFSQKNDSVFISAPGENIVSLSNVNSTSVGLGTSLSAPIVTAAVAIIKEVNPNCSLKEIKELLIKTSVDLGVEGYDFSYGHGVLNVDNIVRNLKDQIPDFLISQGVLNSKSRIHIHNNSNDMVNANIFFAIYADGVFKRARVIRNIILTGGVTNINNDEMFECFFLWDENNRPYAVKYNIK